MNRGFRLSLLVAASLAGSVALVATSGAQPRRGAQPTAPSTPRAAAPIDITGHWVSLITDDWVYRMITPAKGDVSYVPLNAEGRRVAEAWDPARDDAAGEQCKGYAAPAIMRLPSRVEITWQDDNTLKLDIDTGMQTRLFHFNQREPQGARSWQGWSAAAWQLSGTTEQFYPGPTSLGQIKRAGSLKVDTTNLRAGYSAQERRAVQRERIHDGVLQLGRRGRRQSIPRHPDVRRGSALPHGPLRAHAAVQTRARWQQAQPSAVLRYLASSVLLATALHAVPLAAQPAEPAPRSFRIVRNDAKLDELISRDARLELIGDRFGLTEGPVWVPDDDDGYLLFSDLISNVIYRWAPGEPLSVYLDRSGLQRHGAHEGGLPDPPRPHGRAVDRAERALARPRRPPPLSRRERPHGDAARTRRHAHRRRGALRRPALQRSERS